MHLAEYAGGTDKAGDGTMRCLDFGNTVHDGCLACDIEGRRPQDGMGSLKRLGSDIDDHNFLAFLSKQCCGGGANAAASTCDKYDPISAHRRDLRVVGTGLG